MDDEDVPAPVSTPATRHGGCPDLTIPRRFRGPAGSANGGYAAGSLAERVDAGAEVAVEVTLRRPPPLDTALQVRPVNAGGEAAVVLLAEGTTVAEARVVQADPVPVDVVERTVAAHAQQHFRGRHEHPFPGCFGCGPDRAEGDGLRIFPGPVGGPSDTATSAGAPAAAPAATVAAVWTPRDGLAELSDVVDENQRVGPATAWAALDCVGGWAGDMAARCMVLGRMTAQIDALPVVDEPHVVVGTLRGGQRRKTFTASTLYDSDERIVGRAEHVWVTVDPAGFG